MRDGAAAGEVIGGQAGLAGEEVVERACADHFAAVDAGAGAHVDDMVGASGSLSSSCSTTSTVLPRPLQALEGFEQAVIVLLVEADRRLVEDVEHARQAGADLAGEADALALAAGQGAAGAVEVEVIEPDIVRGSRGAR